jgi:uncharacterized protein YecE (DUF72 family)
LLDTGINDSPAAFRLLMRVNVGTAGWTIPRQVAAEFPCEGTSLSRYAARFRVAEINSSFHRPHRLTTWQRWHDSVPENFRFSVKLPKAITHQKKLADCLHELDEFVVQSSTLGDKLGVLLVQLPPKLGFDETVAADFFAALAERTPAKIACEPRHPSWFEPEVSTLLQHLLVARVAADPAISEAAARPGGWSGLSYWRLHGSPVVYRSSYSDRIGSYASKLDQEAQGDRDVWSIFDNTASSAGAGDALALARATHSLVCA